MASRGLTYARSQLFNIRNSLTTSSKCVTLDTARKLKSLSIFKARGSTAGKYKSTKLQHIPVLTSTRTVTRSFTSHRIISTSTQSSFFCTRKSLISIPRVSASETRTLCGAEKSIMPSILVGNVRSVNNKLDLLLITLHNYRPSIVVLTETWLTEETTDFLLAPGYRHFHITREGKRGGGVSILVNSDIGASELASTITIDFEILHVLIKTSSSFAFHLIGIYRPPQGKVENCIVQLHETLSEIFNSSSNTVMVTGDVNRLDLDNISAEFDLCQGIDFHTRGEATLDVFLSNCSNKYEKPVRMAPIGSSDHCLISLKPKQHSVKRSKFKCKVLDTRHQFHQRVHEYLTNVSWDSVYSSRDIGSVSDSFQKHFSYALSLYPVRTVIKSSRDPKWLNPRIIDIQNKRNHAFTLNDLEKFKELSDKLESEIKQSKAGMRENCQAGTKEFWNLVKYQAGTGHNPDDSSYCAVRGDANDLNEELINRFERPSPFSEHSFPTFDISSIPPAVSPFEVLNAMKRLRAKSSAGPDEIPAWFLKQFDVELAEPLAHLFTLSIQQGHFPQSLKTSIVVPIPKVPLPKTFSDLRPISLTSVVSKLLERVVYHRMSNMVNKVISSTQHAYRRKACTTTALVSITHQTLEFLDSHPGSIVRMGLLDFSKAFDSVNCNLLTAKIASHDFPQWFVSWTHSFLTERKQCVRFRGISSPLTVFRGIPQGTVLGPIYFSIYVDDLEVLDDKSFLIRYADDQTLCTRLEKSDLTTPDQYFEAEVCNVMKWCEENEMYLNLSKTKEMIISLSQQDLVYMPLIEIDGTVVERVPFAKILGLHIDCSMNWLLHVEKSVAAASRILYLLRLLKRSCNFSNDDIRLLIRAMLIPKLIYAYPSWCNVGAKGKSKLYSVLRSAHKIIGEDYNQNDLDIMLRTEVAKLFKASQENGHPLYEIIPEQTNQRYTMRRRSIPQVRNRTTKFNKHFLCQGIKLFNSD